MGIEKADFNFMAETQIKVEDTTESSHLLPKTQKLSSETRKRCVIILWLVIMCLCLVELIIGGISILRAISKFKYKGLKLDVFKFDILKKNHHLFLFFTDPDKWPGKMLWLLEAPLEFWIQRGWWLYIIYISLCSLFWTTNFWREEEGLKPPQPSPPLLYLWVSSTLHIDIISFSLNLFMSFCMIFSYVILG